jgi:branched-chain amino acid transport system ATP-binding protein
MKMLRIRNITKHFGGVAAVDDFSYRVERGVILGLIGPNGAGKSTLINLISGLEKSDSGEILFKGENITNKRPYEIAHRGIGRTFQITRVFQGLSVLQNVCVPRLWRAEGLKGIKEEALEVLRFFDLVHMKDEMASNLSGGQQKLLELARISVMDPELLLLDEPFYGIHPKIKKEILDRVVSLNEMGKTFAIISHDVPSIMTICRNIVVMSSGRLIAEGPPEKICSDQSVIEAYLGV